MEKCFNHIIWKVLNISMMNCMHPPSHSLAGRAVEISWIFLSFHEQPDLPVTESGLDINPDAFDIVYWILPCDATGAKVSPNPLWQRNWTPCNFGFRGWWIWSQPPARACQGSTATTMGRTRERASSKTFHNEIRSQPMDGKCLRWFRCLPVYHGVSMDISGWFYSFTSPE